MSGQRQVGPGAASVSVAAPARLHMGFIDLNGGLGRRFGSIGLALEGIVTRVRVSPAAGITAHGPEAERAGRCAALLARAWDVRDGARIEIASAIPAHIGLGSGTQLALAVGRALAELWGVDADAGAIAARADRGARSGIGIGAFEQGGLLVDGGRRAGGGLPRVIARLPFPPEWRVLLILDRRGEGLHGPAELAAFRDLPAFPAEQAAHLSRLVLMQALPALAEADLAGFGAAITELQQRVGDYFAPAQGGRFSSPEVAAALDWVQGQGAQALGQSSWGPTGFCVVASPSAAEALAASARAAFAASPYLEFRVLAARNRGAEIGRHGLALSARERHAGAAG